MDTMVTYRSLEQLLDLVDPPHRDGCRTLLARHAVEIAAAPGSSHNHQAWPGGYLDHVQEVMNVAVVLYAALSAHRPLEHSLSDALVVVFLHDLEKPWAYEMKDGVRVRRAEMAEKDGQQAFRLATATASGLALTESQIDAMRFVEGELGHYSNKRRTMSPLAAFCHLCDVTSARIWFDHPKPDGDPWDGARRRS
jgi:hypothetical protein